ncbi:rcc01693 family protein [Brucellaceae bacterium C25G]
MLSGSFESKSDQDNAFPWKEIMQIGLGQLRLAPKDFWAMSLLELHAMIGAHKSVFNGTDRQTLQALMHSYPDRKA